MHLLWVHSKQGFLILAIRFLGVDSSFRVDVACGSSQTFWAAVAKLSLSYRHRNGGSKKLGKMDVGRFMLVSRLSEVGFYLLYTK